MSPAQTLQREQPRRRARAARWLAAPLLGIAAMLGGCAGMQEVSSKVSSFGTWPEGRQPGTYAFERLPSQQNRANEQAVLEAAAEPALAAAGFSKAADAARADVKVQVGAQAVVDNRSRYDPWYWGPYRPGWGAWRPGFGGWWGGAGRGGMSFSMAMEPPWTQMQVDLLIRDGRNNQVLYETHAVHERLGSPIEELYPFLFQAALKDFPRPAVSPRMVTIPVPEGGR